MHFTHLLRALRAVMVREMAKFVQQRGRLLSALVRPLIWLAVFAAGFYNVFGVSIIPPYKTYITYQVYIVPGLLGMILLFHGMQSSLSMVYDREMGVMRLLLTAPLPRWVLLACKLVAGTALSVITCYVFLAVCIVFDVTFDPIAWLAVLPALIVSGLMLGALWLFLSVYIRQVENFAGAMNFVMFPMFFFSSALYPLWRLREGGSELLYYVSLANPFTYAVELIRFALYGAFDPAAALVVAGTTVLFFLLAVIGYDPQRGMLRRAPQAQAGVINELPDKRAAAQLGERLLQLGLSVHHDRAVPGDRLRDRLAGNQQETNAFVAGLHRDLVAAIEHNQRAIAGLLPDHNLARRGRSSRSAPRTAATPRGNCRSPRTHRRRRGAPPRPAASCACPAAPRHRDSADRRQRLRPGRACPRNRRRQSARGCRRHRRFPEFRRP